MCILIVGKADAVRSTLLDTKGLVKSIVSYNRDGMGMMYAGNGKVVTHKRLLRNTNDARQFLKMLPDDERMVAVHARMQTHGKINLENCHPYKVSDTAWLMHNGVLHTGNAADKNRSDTYHFIADYLQDMSDDVLHETRFLRMMGDFIEDNRFAIVTADGRLSIVNEDQGIHHEGVWFSNTYAWDPELLIPGYRKATIYDTWAKDDYSGYENAGWESYYSVRDQREGGGSITGKSGNPYGSLGKDVSPVLSTTTTLQNGVQRVSNIVRLQDHWAEIDEAIDRYDVARLTTMLRQTPVTTISHILACYVINFDTVHPASSLQSECIKAWGGYDEDKLHHLSLSHASDLADALLMDCDITHIGAPCDE